MPRLALVLVLGSTFLGAADTDKDKLQGTWKAVAVERAGERRDENAHRLMFEGESFIIKRQDDVVARGTFRIDSTKSPKAIDMTITEGKDSGKTALGIFALEGNTLTWCTSEPGNVDRPQELAAKEGSPCMLVVLKREQP